QQREGFPHRLMLTGDDQGAGGDLVETAPLDADSADDPQQPEVYARPRTGEADNAPARQHQRRQRRGELRPRVEVEQNIEGDGTYEQHGRRSSDGRSAGRDAAPAGELGPRR